MQGVCSVALRRLILKRRILVCSRNMSSRKHSEMTYGADGPIEDDKTALEKLRNAGFDPDDVHTARSDLAPNGGLGGCINITPMAHFAHLDDLPMCRYLYHVRGAVTTKAAQEHRTRPDEPVEWYPILSAACRYRYDFDIVKWLYQNGAKSEVLEVSDKISAISKFFFATKDFAVQKMTVDFAKWLILEGVLEEGSDAKPDARRLYHFLYELQYQNDLWQLVDMPKIFTGWMEEILNTSVIFRIFLLGTVRDPQYSIAEMKRVLGRRIRSAEAASMLVDDAVLSGRSREIWDQLTADAGRKTSSNSCLASFPGVLEKIGDYVGIIKNKTKLKRVADAKAIAQSVTVDELRRSSRR